MLRWMSDILKRVVINVLTLAIILGLLWFLLLRNILPI